MAALHYETIATAIKAFAPMWHRRSEGEPLVPELVRPRGLSPASPLTRAVWNVWALAFRRKASLAHSQDRVRPHVDLVAAVARRL